jgi:hypothetical protein
MRSTVSSKDSQSSGINVREDKVRFPWLLIDATNSKEDEAQMWEEMVKNTSKKGRKI